MHLANGFGDRPIKEVIIDHPLIGDILETHGIGCATCSVGTCRLEDIISIHGLSPEKESHILGEISDYLGDKLRPASIDITVDLFEEHKLIHQMVALMENSVRLIEEVDYIDWEFFKEAFNAYRNFVNNFHHKKEEEVLFRELLLAGIPENNSPISAMQMQHKELLSLGTQIEEAIGKGRAEEKADLNLFRGKLLCFISRLKEHVKTEETILLPLADRIIDSERRPLIIEEYRKIERSQLSQAREHFILMLEKHENIKANRIALP
jgi:hemerythrin-like domain-containing protein